MLVLSRKIGETIVIPGMGVTISVERVLGSRVVMGVDAPRHLNVRRRELPVLAGDSQSAAVPAPQPHKERPMPESHVLLAIRPSLTRSEYRGALIHRGFHVSVANDREQCLRILEESAPDVLVLEADLPQGGGDSVLEVVHERLESQGVPVFVLATQQSRSSTYRLARFKISNLVVGPVSAENLADRVAGLAAERRKLTVDVTPTKVALPSV